MTILDREFGKSWLSATFFCLLVFLFLFLLGDLFGLTSDLIENPPTMSLLSEYVFHRAVYGLFFMAPLVGLIGSFWSINSWKQENEWTASLSSGESPLFILRMPIALIIVVTIVLILYSILWLPHSSKRAKFIRGQKFKDRNPESKVFKNLNLKLGPLTTAKIKRFNPNNNSMKHITITKRTGNRIRKRIDAPRATYQGNNTWQLQTVTIRTFRQSGQFETTTVPETSINMDNPEIIKNVFGNNPRMYDRGPEEITLQLLESMIDFRQRHGLNVSVERIFYHWTFAYPLSTAIMSFVGLLIGTKYDLSRARGVGLCLLIGFGYWVLFNTALALGKSSTFPAQMIDYFFDLSCVYGPQLVTFSLILLIGKFQH